MLKGVTWRPGFWGSSTGYEQGIYTLDTGEEGLYIGDWRIECDRLYHRHPEDYTYGLTGSIGVQEYDVNDRVCWKCETRCPNGIWFAHRLQQL